jgi:hypothetical protein
MRQRLTLCGWARPDGKRLNLADTIVMRKETGVDEAGVIEIAQELYIVGTPVGDRDAVFTYLGFGGLALPSPHDRQDHQGGRRQRPLQQEVLDDQRRRRLRDARRPRPRPRSC